MFPGNAKRLVLRIALSFVLAFVVLATAGAQTSNGTVTGRVTDSRQAVIPNASVTVTAADGTFATTAATSSAGIYTVPSLPSGLYTISIEAPGFARADIQNVRVDIAGVATADVALKPGSVKTTVTVTEHEQLLTPSSAALQTTVEKSTIVELPFAERSALGVALFAPGVQGKPNTGDGIGSELPTPTTEPQIPGAGLAIGGSRDGAVAQLMDGLDITAVGYPRAAVTFSGDAIRAVSVQASGLPAQYGRTGGGIVNQASASGTSKYHGALRWRHRDPWLELKSPNSGGSGPHDHLNLFTVAVGGPVPLPFHKGHTFFFAAYEPLRARNLSLSARRVFTPDEIAGRFHNSLDLLNGNILKSSGYAAAVAAPRTGGVYAQFPLNAQGFPIGQRYTKSSQWTQFANDDVSAQAAQNPIAKFLLSQMPTPDKPSPYIKFMNPDGSYAPNGTNAYAGRGVVSTDNRYTIRVDEEVTSRDRVFVRYTSVPVHGVRYDYFGPASPLGQWPEETLSSQNASVNYVRVISNQMVNELHEGYIRLDRNRSPVPASLTKDFGAALGLTPAIMGAGMPAFVLIGSYPGNITIGNGGGGVGAGVADPGKSIDQSFATGDDLSIVHGSHSFRLGVDYRAMQLNRRDISNLYGGSYAFGSFTSGPSGGYSALADLDLGLFKYLNLNTPYSYYYRYKYGAAYFQDDWRILPNMTLNLGLRYQVETPRMEKFNYQGSFIPNGAGTLNGVNTTGGFAFSGTNGLSESLWPINYLGFEPRLGIAYAPARFMTARVAYSLIHAPLTGYSPAVFPNLTSGSATIGFNGTGGVNTVTANPNNPDPNCRAAGCWANLITNPIDPAAAIPGQAPTRSSTLLTSWNASNWLPAISQSKAVPYVQLWTASLQFQIGKSSLVEVDYAGQRGVHLYATPVPINDPPISTLLSMIQSHVNFITTNKDQYGNKVNAFQAARPYPQFYSNPIWSAYDRTAGSNYNAVYITGQYRAGLGLTLRSSFTWGKSLDNASSSAGGQPGVIQFTGTGVAGYPQGYSTAGDYSVSGFDIPVNWNSAYVWQLPVGRKQKFAANAPRWLDSIIGGWNTSGQVLVQTGYPLDVFIQQTTSAGYFYSTAPGGKPGSNGTALSEVYLRPNIVPGVPLINKGWKKNPFGTGTGPVYLNSAAFSLPGSLDHPAFGNARRFLDGARNPGAINWNASLRKKTAITERVNFEMWTDVIGVLNHRNYFMVSGTGGHALFTGLNSSDPLGGYNVNPSFGTMDSAYGTRNINIGAAITF